MMATTNRVEFVTMDEIIKVKSIFLDRDVEFIRMFVVEIVWLNDEEGLARRKTNA